MTGTNSGGGGGISALSGGGALSAIGETFQPDLHTGTGNLSVPIPLPPGRHQLTPTLTLGYSTGAGNGPFGLGWSLSLPGVARRTDLAVPQYDDTVDTFVLSGAEELVPVPARSAALAAGSPDTLTRYRPRTESGFARIVHITGRDGDYWEVFSPDGLRSRYGTRRPANADTTWADPAVITNPDRGGGAIFAWLISETVDPLGNRIDYNYQPDPNGGPQRYLAQVGYVDYGDPATPTHLVQVSIDYDAPLTGGDPGRPVSFTDRRCGFALTTALRARTLTVATRRDAATAPITATTVALRYADDDGHLSAAGLSLLTGITITGVDGTATQQLPPLEFGYTGWDPTGRRFRLLSDQLPTVPLGSGGTELVDCFGDGLPSLMQINGGAYYWRNRGEGRFDRPRTLAATPAGAHLGTPGVLLADLDRDGRDELIVSTPTRTSRWPLAHPGETPYARAGFDPAGYRSGPAPTIPLSDPRARLVDVTGDHIPDLLIAIGPRPLLAAGDGTGGFGPPMPLPAGNGLPELDLTDPRLHLADMTGDGLQDVVLAGNRHVRYWPNLGYGRFGPPVDIAGPPDFADGAQYDGLGFDPRRLLLGDVDGTGTADVLYVGDGHVTLWINQCGTRFAPPVIIPAAPRVSDLTAVRLIDLDGAGVAGLMYSNVGRDGRFAFLDVTGGLKPYLLDQVDNHAGAATTISYATSTHYATADRDAGRPWATTLPFPVHVVAATATVDTFSGTRLTSSFGYHNGYWDPIDREFRGFASVEQTDTLTPLTPPAPAPAVVETIDPLAPRGSVPAGFDPVAAGNLLTNWSFDTASTSGSSTLTTTPDDPTASGGCAAAGWSTWNNTATTTTTELQPSDLPQGNGGQMLHVNTGATGCGIMQTFSPAGTGPANVIASVWVKVVRGSVALGASNGGNTSVAAGQVQPGGWTLLQAGNLNGPANELVIYAAGDGGAEYFLDHAWVTEPSGPAEPLADPAPVRTVTWFHPGPLARPNGAWSVLEPTPQYWPDDLPLTGQVDTGPLTAADGTPPPQEVLREAIRALRGRVLRTELYADDASRQAARPYEIHDHSYQLAPVLDARTVTDPAWQGAPVVTVRPVHTRSSVWERGTDPMIRLKTLGRYDDYGRPAAMVDAAAPRGRDPRQPGAACLATVTITDHATRDDTNHYLIDRVTRTIRHVAVDDETRAVANFTTIALDGSLAGELRAVTRTYYDGDPFTGLPLGQLGEHGLPARTEQLVLTPDILNTACAAGPTGLPAPIPPYLHADGTTDTGTWPVEYPAAFRTAVLDAPATRGPQLGYTWHPDGPDGPAGYYASTSRLCYDVQTGPGRGLVTVSRNPYGGDTTTSYDTYSLLPILVTDPAGLPTTAQYNTRVLKPDLITDPNGNQTAIGYTPLGLTAWTARLGKPNTDEGDTADQSGTVFTYDLTAWDDSLPIARRPMSVTTIRRVEHRWSIVAAENTRRTEAGQPPLTPANITALFTDEPADHFVRTTEYSDGFGRLLQTRTQSQTLTIDADDDLGLPDDPNTPAGTATATIASPDQPPVVVSGWTVYDNKGRAIIGYEPYLDTGYDYLPPNDAQLAALARTLNHYDPRGLLIRTVAADRSETLTVPGIPRALATPLDYQPSPWESYTYDPSDNAARTHPTSTLQSATAGNTPASTVFDPLGRTVTATARTIDPGTDDLVELTTTTSYDIDGHPLSVTDPLGRLCAQTVYDLAGHPCRTWSLDSGTTHAIRNATGTPVEQRNDNAAVTFADFDTAHRPLHGWAADTAGRAATLQQATVYGDDPTESGLTPQQASAVNALGRVVLALDDAGQITTSGYDLDGNPIGTTRRILEPQQLLGRLPTAVGGSWADTAYRVDWQPPPGQTLRAHAAPLLDTTDYTTDTTFDALGRLTTQTDPARAGSDRAVRKLGYTPIGAITTVHVDGTTYLDSVVYDAHGRRQLAVTGNGLVTRYRYNPRTFRLTRQHTIKAQADTSHPATRTWNPASGTAVLQDSSMRYDLAGNLITLAERSPGCGLLPVPNALDRQFSYDPLHRLSTATGRETDIRADPPWLDPQVLPGRDTTQARKYKQTYSYDHVGNLIELAHATPTVPGAGFTRSYTLLAENNRLATLDTSGNKTADYTYDACGNMSGETTSRLLEWDHANHLLTFRTQATATSEPSVYAQYRYDATGSRIIKLVRRTGRPDEVMVYLGGFERIITLPTTAGGAATRHDITHINDRLTHIAEIHAGDPLRDDGLADHPVRYQHADQVGSVTLSTSDTGDELDREEYSPYGETTFGSYARKRYRYTGKERDEESSLSYGNARFFAPWLCRWISCDPIQKAAGFTPFSYCRDNPTTFVDPAGTTEEPAVDQAGGKLYSQGEVGGWRALPEAPKGPPAPQDAAPGAEPRAEYHPDDFVPTEPFKTVEDSLDKVTKLIPTLEELIDVASKFARAAGPLGATAIILWPSSTSRNDTRPYEAPGQNSSNEPHREPSRDDRLPMTLPSTRGFSTAIQEPSSTGAPIKEPSGVTNWIETASQVHHIVTKYEIGLMGPLLRGFLQRAGLEKGVENPLNKMSIEGHSGPHSAEYHMWIYFEFLSATEGKLELVQPGEDQSQFSLGVKQALEAIRIELAEHPERVRR